MHRIISLSLGILVGITLIMAGCTQTSPQGTEIITTTPANPVSSSGYLESLILTPADLHNNVTLISSREKTRDEVGNVAGDLGWQKAYVAGYRYSGEETVNATEILQTITVYPEQNIPSIITLIEKQEKSDTAMVFSDLQAPAGIPDGKEFRASKITGTVKPTTAAAGDPFIHSPETATNTAGAGKDFVEIMFSKGNILEVIRISGTDPDNETLNTLAQVAYNRLL
jgi:hypothetical protein